MGYRFSAADVDFLVGADDLLAELAESLTLTPESLISDLAIAGRKAGAHSAAAVETLTLRRRAAAKLGERAAGWLLTGDALQQATPVLVAEHRATRLAGLAVHDVTCSIGADLGPLAKRCPQVLGSDLDPIRVRMARHNLGPGVGLTVADALRPVSRGLLPYADPARRDGAGRRILSAATLPALADLDHAWSHRLPVLRVPPGIDYEELGRPGEVEVVSLDGSAREAVLWPPELARARRRATVLSSLAAPYQLTDSDPDDVPAGGVGAWIVDPDAAVVRAHLVRHFAARHGLWQLDPRLAYLTGDAAPPVGRAFRVLESAPFTERTVAGWLRTAAAGAVEIKVRGLPVIPDELRLRLRKSLVGKRSQERTLILARVGRGAMAYLTQAQRAS